MCVCICVNARICLYIFCTFVYLYLLVYKWHFNIFLIYFELGKHVCIFLHSFIFWQIDTYWLTLGTFKRNSDISWRIACRLDYSRKKKSKQGQSWRTKGHFWKNSGILGLSLYLWKLWIPEKKRVHPRKFCKIVVHSFFGLEISTRPKTKTHGNSIRFFLDHLITPTNSTSFIINPWNFLMLDHFFNIPTPGICMSSTPSPLWLPSLCFWIFLE